MATIRDSRGRTRATSAPWVADFHRNLIGGGIFMYPADTRNTHGKLRLLYECVPMAFLAEAAGGKATDGRRRILEIEPTALHQRTPLVIGGAGDVDYVKDGASEETEGPA